MKPEHLKQLIEGKRQWSEPLTPEEQAKGFKGWYSSKYLPHFDSPGAQQYLTYRLADSLPSERRGEWEAFMALEDDLEKQRKRQGYIRDEEHLRRVVRYIENNPVKAHLARSAAEWPSSSARFRSKADLSARTLTHPGADRVPDKPV
jgi:hypothetical protein